MRTRYVRLSWIRGKELFHPRFHVRYCAHSYGERMERLISIRRKSDDWFFDRFLQISSDLRITFTRFVQTRVMRVFAYNALMIYRDLVLTGFFHSRFSTKMFCYCFIIMENIWSKIWHENINMLFVLNVLLSMFKWRFVKCVLFINISHQSLRIILRYFDCYVNIYNLKFCE